jgi:hypothetical protein
MGKKEIRRPAAIHPREPFPAIIPVTSAKAANRRGLVRTVFLNASRFVGMLTFAYFCIFFKKSSREICESSYFPLEAGSEKR